MSEVSKTVSSQFRHDDSLIITKTTTMVKPVMINFQDILDAVEVVIDDNNDDKPWEAQDGYSHRAIYRPRDSAYGDRADVEEMRGYAYSMGNKCRVLIVPEEECEEFRRYLKDLGCSKQVVREIAAMDRRRIVDHLVEWYENGWYWYGVRGEYEGVEASVWGIDDDVYAEEYVRKEIADEIADELEEDGFKVVGRMSLAEYTARDRMKDRIERNRHLFDVDGPDVREARPGRPYKNYGEWYAATVVGGVI